MRFAEQASGMAAPVDPRVPTVDVRLRDGSWLRTRLTDASRDELQLLIPWFTGTPRALSVPLRRVAQLTVR